MGYAVLLLHTASTVSLKIAEQLQRHKKSFSRLATSQRNESKTAVPEELFASFERVGGIVSDPETYRDFDIVIMCIEVESPNGQEELVDAIYAGGVRHIYYTPGTFVDLHDIDCDLINLISFQVNMEPQQLASIDRRLKLQQIRNSMSRTDVGRTAHWDTRHWYSELMQTNYFETTYSAYTRMVSLPSSLDGPMRKFRSQAVMSKLYCVYYRRDTDIALEAWSGWSSRACSTSWISAPGDISALLRRQ
jgi:hypothetical protein